MPAPTLTTELIDEISLLNKDPTYSSFLAPTGNLIIACGDKECTGKRLGFQLPHDVLTQHSALFRDLKDIASPTTSTEVHTLQVEEPSKIVGLVLSVIFEPSRTVLAYSTTSKLQATRDLAIKWQMDHVRTHLLFAIISAIPRGFRDGPLDVKIIAEAMYQGVGAFELFKNAIRACRRDSKHPITLKRLYTDGSLVTEFGGAEIPIKALIEIVRFVNEGDAKLEKGW